MHAEGLGIGCLCAVTHTIMLLGKKEGKVYLWCVCAHIYHTLSLPSLTNHDTTSAFR